MSRLIGPLSALLLLLLLGMARLKIAHDETQLAAQQASPTLHPPPSMMPSGLDGRSLNANSQPIKHKPPDSPAVQR